MEPREVTATGISIRLLRAAQGITQAQLAAAAGLSITALRDLEQGITRSPRLTTLERLACALGSSPAELEDARYLARTGSAGLARPIPALSRGRRLTVRVLGPLAAWRGNVPLPLGPARHRAVLAVLALYTGSLVHRDTISDALWAQKPPATATAIIQNAISHLRRALTRPAIITAGNGYLLATRHCDLDLIQYNNLARAADAARQAGNWPGARDLYEKALALWTDEPAADIEVLQSSPILTAMRASHASLICQYAEHASNHGSHARVLPHLLPLTQRELYDERAHACLMIAQAGTGSPAAALATYQQIRARLGSDLGLSPGPYLTTAHARVLRGAIVTTHV